MPLRQSTGLRNTRLSTKSFLSIFVDCFVDVYTGLQPTSPDDAPTGTLLCRYYSDAASLGLEFSAAVSGVLGKKSAETWSGYGIAKGTAGWFRMKEASDTGVLSTTECRLDGPCATSGSNVLLMTSLSIEIGALQTISLATITEPSE
jgi:hypothetical protein